LLLLTSGNRLLLSEIAGELPAGDEVFALPAAIPENEGRLLDARILSLTEPLLVATSFYRFLLTTPGHLLDLQAMGLAMADFYHFRPDEYVCALGRWETMKQREKFILVTTRGYARAYNLDGLIESVEGPTPLQFDRPLSGLPAAVFGAEPTDELLIFLDNGRGVRYCIGDLPLRGIQAINRRDGEQLAGTIVTETNSDLLLITADGYGKRLPAAWVPIPDKANTRGRVILARTDLRVAAAVPESGQIWALTAGEMIPLEIGRLPFDEEGSTKSHKFLKKKVAGEVLAFLQL
jgi:DNA gyrase/topoisomerase IV subunit A